MKTLYFTLFIFLCTLNFKSQEIEYDFIPLENYKIKSIILVNHTWFKKSKIIHDTIEKIYFDSSYRIIKKIIMDRSFPSVYEYFYDYYGNQIQKPQLKDTSIKSINSVAICGGTYYAKKRKIIRDKHARVSKIVIIDYQGRFLGYLFNMQLRSPFRERYHYKYIYNIDTGLLTQIKRDNKGSFLELIYRN